jgi:hypothetical protein
MKNKKEERGSGLNKTEVNINRGFELMLRKNSTREENLEKLKTFEIKFGKSIFLLGKEINFGFNIFLDINANSQEK